MAKFCNILQQSWNLFYLKKYLRFIFESRAEMHKGIRKWCSLLRPILIKIVICLQVFVKLTIIKFRDTVNILKCLIQTDGGGILMKKF
jgi:hypothetical protein